jgi:hypothetical protein
VLFTVVVVVVAGTVVVVVAGTVVVVVAGTVVVVVAGTVVVVVAGTVVVVVSGGTVVVVVVVAGTVVVVVVDGTVVVVVVVVVDGTVSYEILSAELASFPLPTESVNTPAPTEIDAAPEEFTAGVNVAVYEDPEPLKPDNDPPETVTSPTKKFVVDSDSVNVNKSVPPTPKVPDPFREIETVGGVVSIVTVPVDAAEMLPAASAA